MFDFAQHTFFWSLINFALLLAFLHRFVWGPFLGMIDAEESKRQKLQSELEAKIQHHQALCQEYTLKLRELENDAKKMIENTYLETQEIKRQELEKIHQEKQIILASIKDEMNVEKKKLYDQMTLTLGGLIVSGAQKILGREVSSLKHQDVVSENLKQVESYLK